MHRPDLYEVDPNVTAAISTNRGGGWAVVLPERHGLPAQGGERDMHYSNVRVRSQLAVAGAMLACSLAAAWISPQPAEAYSFGPVCGRWSSPPQVVIHLPEWTAGGGAGDDTADLFDAVTKVNRELNLVGGTTTLVASDGAPGLSMRSFDIGTPFLDTVLAPTIHIGFTSDPTDIPITNSVQPEAGTVGPTGVCPIATEARMVFLAPDQQDWNFSTPQVSGEDYHTAGRADATGAVWFRQVYLHELLHAFGMSHFADEYSYMNGGGEGFPWANRTGPHSVRPLPDDVEFLRDWYPAAGARSEVAVLNTWFNDSVNVPLGQAAPQRFNCAPSLGLSESASSSAALCGTGLTRGEAPDGVSVLVCPNDNLWTRFSIANYSTSAVDLEARIYLSRDKVWDAQDWASITSQSVPVGESDSVDIHGSWKVPDPSALSNYLYVIARVTGETSTGDSVEDWIPMTGKVRFDQCAGEGTEPGQAAEIPETLPRF